MDVRDPGRGVYHERINPLPLQPDDFHRLEFLPRPLELFTVTRHRTFDDRRREGHDVVDELTEGQPPTTFQQLVLNLLAHAFDPQLGLLA